MGRLTRAEWTALTCILLAVAVTRLISIYCFYLYDDAFITFRYTANLVQGNGFVYTIGQRVQGTTCPLWALALGIPHSLGLSLELSSRVLGLLFELAVAATVYFALIREKLQRAALIGGFLFAVDLYLAKVSVSGMESSLLLLGTAGATALAVRGRSMSAAAIAALCVFLRPEALLFAVALTGYLWYEDRRLPVKPLLLGAAIILAGVAVQTWYFGDLIPQSVRGKMALPRSDSMLFSVALFPYKNPLQALMTVTALLSVRVAWRVSRFARIYMLWALLLVLSWALTGAHLWMWYCIPVFFAKALLTGIGAAEYFKSTALSRMLNPLLLLGVTVLLWSGLAMAVGPDRMEKNVYSRIRRWSAEQDFGQNGAHPKAYGMDFGAFGFYTGLPVIDEPGLVYPPSLSRYHTDPVAMLLGEQPEWAFVTCYDGNIAMMRSGELARMYAPLIRFSIDGDTTISPDLKDVSPIWKPDFILYRKLPGGS